MSAELAAFLLAVVLLSLLAGLYGRVRLAKDVALADRRTQPGMLLTPALGGFAVQYSRHVPGDTALILPGGAGLCRRESLHRRPAGLRRGVGTLAGPAGLRVPGSVPVSGDLMAVQDFSRKPFYAGSVTGIRSFGVQFPFAGGASRLVGPVYPDSFKPGENIAVCKASPLITVPIQFGLRYVGLNTSDPLSRPLPPAAQLSSERMIVHLAGMLDRTALERAAASFGFRISYRDPDAPPGSEEHQVARLGCTCGYYAYFDTGANPHHNDARILGLIEGYGNVTIGDRGFRASKARLLALIGQPSLVGLYDPDPVPEALLDTLPAALLDVYQVPGFPTVEAALAEYPLTDPNEFAEAASEATKEDEDGRYR